MHGTTEAKHSGQDKYYLRVSEWKGSRNLPAPGLHALCPNRAADVAKQMLPSDAHLRDKASHKSMHSRKSSVMVIHLDPHPSTYTHTHTSFPSMCLEWVLYNSMSSLNMHIMSLNNVHTHVHVYRLPFLIFAFPGSLIRRVKFEPPHASLL